LPDKKARNEIYASPLQASLEQLKGQAGLIHDYGLLNPLANVPAVKTALLHAAASIRKALGG